MATKRAFVSLVRELAPPASDHPWAWHNVDLLIMSSQARVRSEREISQALDELLFERELRGLHVPVIGRIGLGAIGIPGLFYTAGGTAALGLDPSIVFLFLGAMIAVAGINIYFLTLLRAKRRVAFVGLLGALLDGLLIVSFFALTFAFSKDFGLSPAAIFKSELPVVVIAFTVINGLALRPRYPIIVGTASTGVLLVTAVYAALDPSTVFSSDWRETIAGAAMDAPQLVTTVLFAAGITAAVAYITAVARRTIRAGITSELENARLQRDQLRLVMREKVEALGRLVAGVSHEINNPLGVAKSGIDTERRALEKIGAALPEESETGQRALEAATGILTTITEALDRIEATENSLRAFAHLDEADFQKVRLDEELRIVISLLPPELDVRERIELRHAPGLPELYVNARDVNQMFMTLLRRAFETLPERSGLVAISTRSEEDAVLIEISDNGDGMDEETQRTLFDVTLRSHGSRVAADFDLPTAQAIAQRHGGDITVASKLGHGATLTVRLPTRAKPEPS